MLRNVKLFGLDMKIKAGKRANLERRKASSIKTFMSGKMQENEREGRI